MLSVKAEAGKHRIFSARSCWRCLAAALATDSSISISMFSVSGLAGSRGGWLCRVMRAFRNSFALAQEPHKAEHGSAGHTTLFRKQRHWKTCEKRPSHSLEKSYLGVWVCLHIVHPLEGLQSLLGLLCLASGALCCFCLVFLLLSLHTLRGGIGQCTYNITQKCPALPKSPTHAEDKLLLLSLR